MNWAMKDPAFKIQLFRFIDVFPMLDGPQVIHDYLLDYLSDPDLSLPPGMELIDIDVVVRIRPRAD